MGEHGRTMLSTIALFLQCNSATVLLQYLTLVLVGRQDPASKKLSDEVLAWLSV